MSAAQVSARSVHQTQVGIHLDLGSGLPAELDRLEQQGLIERVPDPADRRAIRLGVTDAGRRLIDDAFTTSVTMYRSMLNQLTSAEAKTFEVLLQKVLTRLDDLTGKREPWLSE